MATRTISLQLLGGFELHASEPPRIGPLPRKARGLLAYLALARPRTQTRDRLAGLLWPEDTGPAARASLRQTMAVIRRDVGPVLATEGDGVALLAGAFAVDVGEVESTLASPQQSIRRAALDLYRGDLLDGFSTGSAGFDQWCTSERELLRQRVLAVAGQLLSEDAAHGQIDSAIVIGQRILSLEPFREDVHRSLMQLYARRGQSALAVELYQNCRRLLRQELGIEPEPATKALFAEIARSRAVAHSSVGIPPAATDPVRLPEGAANEALSTIGSDGRSEAYGTPQTSSSRAQRTPDVSGDLAGERRQVTVMICKMTDAAGLLERFGDDIFQRVSREFAATCIVHVTKFGGHVHDQNDGTVSIFFGFPAAIESAAERAVHAGIVLLEAISRMTMPVDRPMRARIAIACGSIVVTSAGHRAMGDGIDCAIRLAGAEATPGLFIDATVRRLAGNAFRYEGEAAGGHGRDGGHEDSYRVSGSKATLNRFQAAFRHRLTPLVAREPELRLLLDRWSEVGSGEGQAVLVSGEPGIGKSRLLHALREHLDSEGTQAHCLQCSPHFSHSALWPIVEYLRRQLKLDRAAAPEAQLRRLEAWFVRYLGRAPADLPYLCALLSLPFDPRVPLTAAAPQRLRDETNRILADLVAASAHRSGALLLLIEDIHWADPTSLEVLDLLLHRLGRIPALLVVTHRHDFRYPPEPYGQVSGVTLSRLTREQSMALVARIVGGERLPDALRERIVFNAEGVPLFLEELTQSVLDAGQSGDTGGRSKRPAAPGHVAVPVTLKDLLVARIDRTHAARRVAQIGSALGREFAHALLAAVAPGDRDSLEDGLTELTRCGLLFRQGTPPDASYVFKHALVQEAAYETLLESDKRMLHGRIADALRSQGPDTERTAPEALADHLTRAGRNEEAVPLWQAAGELALSRMALREAIAHLDAALAAISTLPRSPDTDERELAIRLRLGTAWMGLKGWAAKEVSSSLRPALDLARTLGRHDALAQILSALPQVLMCQGKVEESLPLVDDLLATARASGDAGFEITAHTRACNSYFYLGNLERTLEHADEVSKRYDEQRDRGLVDQLNHDPKSLVTVFSAIATWVAGYPDRAVKLLAQADDHARRRGHPFDFGFVLALGAEVYDFCGDYEMVSRRAAAAEAIGWEHGLPVMSALLVPFATGMAAIRAGDPHEGIALLESGLSVWESAGGAVRSPFIKAIVAEGLAKTGRVDAALTLVDAQIAQIERPGWGERLYFAEILRLKGWILECAGRHDAAERACRLAVDRARAQKSRSWELRAAIDLAGILRARGATQDALALLGTAYRSFTEGFATVDLLRARALLDELAPMQQQGPAP